MKRRTPCLVDRIDLGAIAQQEVHHLYRALERGVMQMVSPDGLSRFTL